MKIIKLTAITAAVLASSAALAAPMAMDNAGNTYEVAPVAYVASTPSYAYDRNAGIIRNTTGAFLGTTKTIFNTLTHPASVSAEVGSLGYGANVGFSVNEKVELQAGWAGGNAADLFGGDFDANDVNYDVDTDFSNPYMGVQLRPAGNWFTMGAGIIVPDNDIDVVANADGGVSGFYEVEDVKYDATGVTLAGTLEHRNKLAPYATIGFRPNISNNFGIFGEIGAAYMGKTDATIRSLTPGQIINTEVNGVASTATGAQLAAAAERELEDEDYIEWLPIVKLGATYRF